MTVTKPITKLAALLETEERSAAWLGRRLRVSRQTTAAWVAGRDPVPLIRRAQIAAALDWHTPSQGPLFDRDGVALPQED